MNLSIFVNNSEGGTVGSYPDSIGLQRNFNIRFPESDMTNNVFIVGLLLYIKMKISFPHSVLPHPLKFYFLPCNTPWLKLDEIFGSYWCLSLPAPSPPPP